MRVSEKLRRLWPASKSDLDRLCHLIDHNVEQTVTARNKQALQFNQKFAEVIAGLDNQSRMLIARFAEVLMGLDNQSQLLNDRFGEVIIALNNQSRLVNDRFNDQSQSHRREIGLEQFRRKKPRLSSSPSPPRILCIGAGRDGTQSVYRMIQDVFDGTDGRTAMHEYCSRELSQAFCDYKETHDERFADDIRQLIDECPYDCIVGNGYAAILRFFWEIWGPETKLVQIRRLDRNGCIASLIKNCELFPIAYRYYSTAVHSTVKRMAAFHFGEMTKEAWDAISILDKFAWYYDKTHELIGMHKPLFAEQSEISTESLNEEATRRRIARLVSGSESVLPPVTHLNAHAFDIASIAGAHRSRAMWLLGQLNWDLLSSDDVYGIEYFLNKFLAWTGYQISEDSELMAAMRPSDIETAATLARARAILEAALKDIDDLEILNLRRGANLAPTDDEPYSR